jgi:hypothetical protein
MAPTSIIQLTRQARGARAASRCARCSTQASPRVKSRRRERWRGNNRQVRRCESSCPRLAQARPYSLTARNSTIYAGRSCGRGLLCRKGLPQADRRITTWESGRRRDGWTRRFLRGRMPGRPAAPHRLGRCDDRDDPRTARATNYGRGASRAIGGADRALPGAPAVADGTHGGGSGGPVVQLERENALRGRCTC